MKKYLSLVLLGSMMQFAQGAADEQNDAPKTASAKKWQGCKNKRWKKNRNRNGQRKWQKNWRAKRNQSSPDFLKKVANLNKVFANHPAVVQELVTTYQARDPLGRRRGFRQFNSSKMIVLASAMQNDTTFLSQYIDALVSEMQVYGNNVYKKDAADGPAKGMHLLSVLVRAKQSVYENGEIGQLIEYRDLEAQEKGQKVAAVMKMIDKVFAEKIPQSFNEQLTAIGASHVAERKAKKDAYAASLKAALK